MRYFCTAVEAGSISGAAARLGLAQTALSIQIRDLEAEIGVKVLRRHSRGVEPTEAGVVLYRRHQEIERALEQTLQEVRAAGGAAEKPLVIGVIPSIMRLVGADLVIEGTRQSPALTIRFVEELSFALVEAVLRGDLDFALAYEVTGRPGLGYEALLEDELFFVTAPGRNQTTEPIGFAEAVSHQLFFAGDKGIVALIRQTAERLGLEPRIVSDIQSVAAIRARVAEGGASLLPYGTAAEGLARDAFALRRVERPALRRTLYLIWRSGEGPMLDGTPTGAFLSKMVRAINAASPYSTIISPRYRDG